MAMKVAVLIPAAGASRRFKGKNKKQFANIDNRAVFLRTIEQFADRDDVCKIVMAIPAEDEELFNIKWRDKLVFHGVRAIIGAEQRHETVSRLLAEVAQDELDLIALHDAVRPCVTAEQIDAVFAAAAKSGAAILANPVAATIKRVGKDNVITETVDRADLWEAQTPQVFKPDIIRKAHEQAAESTDDITDDAQLVEALGIDVTVVAGSSANIKITSNADLTVASAILKSRTKPKAKGPVGPWAAEQGW